MSNKKHISITETLRPTNLNDFIGQKDVIGPNTVLQQLISKGYIPNMIIWGPPGCGKSSLANVILCLSKEVYKENMQVITLSAVSCGVNNIRDTVAGAKNGSTVKKQTIVLMDKIHQFNKLQQDIFLPHIEAGTFALIGTTTENPSYSLNPALLSRCRVFHLNKLTVSDITEILSKAILFLKGKICTSYNEKFQIDSRNMVSSTFKPKFIIHKTVIDWLAEICDGDARVALNGLEVAVNTEVFDQLSHPCSSVATVTLENIKRALQQAHVLCDKETNHSHHLYSALHKSIRAGNANASLYWLARIMASKEDPVDIARRLVRISSEDVGLADPDALGMAVHVMHGCQMIGMPECDVLLGQCVVYLTKAPKSRLVYNALKSAKNIIIHHKGPQPNVPLHIRDRSGQRELQASHGHVDNELLRKEDNKINLPLDLKGTNFFLEDW